MREMASSIVESIRESKRLITDNLRNLASNIHPTTSQTTAIQNSQARVRERHRISRMSRRRHSEIRNTVNYSDSSEIDDGIGLSGATESSNRIHNLVYVMILLNYQILQVRNPGKYGLIILQK